MTGQQAALDYARDLMEKGMSLDDANVTVVRMMGVRLIHGKMDRRTRNALMAGVKDGRLGHITKENLKPEVFFHPNAMWKAKDMRDAEANAAVRAIASVFVVGQPLGQ
jgi:hypothetical protein